MQIKFRQSESGKAKFESNATRLEIHMRQQIAIVEQRDGSAAARTYAAQTLRVYRGAAQFRDAAGRRHFAHDHVYRRFFVTAICEIRNYLRSENRPNANT